MADHIWCNIVYTGNEKCVTKRFACNMECRIDYSICLRALRALGRGLFYRLIFCGWYRNMAHHIWYGSLCMDVEKWVTKRECSSKTNCMGNRSLAYMVSTGCGSGLNQMILRL